jgi:chromosome segregation ATPase
MSIVKDLKNAQTKIEAMQGELAGAFEERDNAKAETERVRAEVTEKLTAHEATIDTLKAEAVAAVQAHEAAIAEIQGKVDGLAEERDAITAECEKLQRALADPAFVAAGAQGEKPVDGGGDASDGKTLTEQLNAITDPTERAKFYKANRAAIKAESKA